jgi:hypothetical protein
MNTMLQTALREDALTSTSIGFELRLGLPWIRSMPLAGVRDLKVEIDGAPVGPGELTVVLGPRQVSAQELEGERGWWFVQDRLVLAGLRKLHGGTHRIAVDFHLLVPYLQVLPGSPLVLPFHVEARLEPDHAPVPSVSRDVA